MNAATTLAASVQAKKGRLYAVIQVRENGKTKPVWRALGLPESANKSKVNKAYREVVQAFEQSYAEQIAQNKKPWLSLRFSDNSETPFREKRDYRD